jgi:hypothetical protein
MNILPSEMQKCVLQELTNTVLSKLKIHILKQTNQSYNSITRLGKENQNI